MRSRDMVAGGGVSSQPMSNLKACQVRRIAFVGDLSSSYDAAVFFLTWRRDYSERECDVIAPNASAAYATPVAANLRKGMNAAGIFLFL
jgi:hypothetical protein